MEGKKRKTDCKTNAKWKLRSLRSLDMEDKETGRCGKHRKVNVQVE